MKKLKRLQVNKHMLYVLNKAPPKLRKVILQTASNDLIKAICEIVLNILADNHKICNKTKTKLEKYKSQLRDLVKPSRSLAFKRKVLVQKGGNFLPILLSSILSGVIGKILQQNE